MQSLAVTGRNLRLALPRLIPMPLRLRVPPHQPVVVLTLERISADWFHRLLAGSALRWQSNNRNYRLRVVRAASPEALRRLIAKQPRFTIIVVEIERWLAELEACHLFYLRPGLLILKDILPGLAPRAPEIAAPLFEIDDRLAGCPGLDWEVLFHEPQRVVEFFAGFGLRLNAARFPQDGPDRYRQALVSLLRLIEQGGGTESPMTPR